MSSTLSAQNHGNDVDWLQQSAGTTNNRGSSSLRTGTFEPSRRDTGLELLDAVRGLGLNQNAVLILVNFCHLGEPHDFGRGLFSKVLIGTARVVVRKTDQMVGVMIDP